MKRFAAALLFCAASSTASLSHGQAFTFSKTVIDPNPHAAGRGLSYDKLVDHFTAADHLSYFLGSQMGAYIYDPTAHRKITVGTTGTHYERAKSFLYRGDRFPGVVSSLESTLVWYRNPANQGGKVDDNVPWEKFVINPNAACHDLHVVDLDGDGKEDVVCSATYAYGKPGNFVAFQNSANDWQVVSQFNPSGDGIALVSIKGVNGGARNNIVACNPQDNHLYWYRNPSGPSARDPAKWVPSMIGGCTGGVAIASLNVGTRDIVIVASNETLPAPWPNGLAYYDIYSTPSRPWKLHNIDRTYRDVHEIAGGTLSGVPFITVGEEEQASAVCNEFEPRQNEHPAIKGCRVSIFPWTGNGFGEPTLLSNLGTQNQEVLVVGDTGYVIGANHTGYRAVDPAFNLWQFRLRTAP